MGRRTALPQEDLEELYHHADDPKVRLKILVLLQLKEGKTIKETTEIFKIHRDTVRNWIKQ